MFCPNCGVELITADKFCKKCGVSLESLPAQETALPSVVPGTSHPADLPQIPAGAGEYRAQSAYPSPPANYAAPVGAPPATNVAPEGGGGYLPQNPYHPSPANYAAPVGAPPAKKSHTTTVLIIVGAVVLLLVVAAIVFFAVANPFVPKPTQNPAEQLLEQLENPATVDPPEGNQGTALDDEVIRNTLKFEFDLLKNQDSPLWTELIEGEAGELEALGMDVKAFMASWMEGFDYELGAVTIDGNKATIEATITCKQMYPVLAGTQDVFLKDPSLQNLSEEELMLRVVQILMEEIDKAPLVTTTVSIPFEKSGGVWTQAPEAESILKDVMLGEE